jgi:hypothetical protein
LGSAGTLLAGNGGLQIFGPCVTDGRCGWSARAHLGQPTNEANIRSQAKGVVLPTLMGEWWSNCKRYHSLYGKGPSLSQSGALLFLGRWHRLRYRMRVNRIWHNNYQGAVSPPWSTYAMRVCRFACCVLEVDKISVRNQRMRATPIRASPGNRPALLRTGSNRE